MCYERVLDESLLPAYERLKSGLLRLIDEGKISREDAARVLPELLVSEDEIHRKWILEYLYDGLRKADEQFKDHFKSAIDWLEKQKEQMPVELDEEIELGIDRARQIVFAAKGNLEGYQSDDGIYECDSAIEAIDVILKNGITTKPVEKQDYSGLNDLERAIHRGFLVAGVENVSVTIIKETAQDCLAHMHAEWSEEDERRIDAICELLENTSAIHPNYSHRKLIIWLKSLRPIKQEWSEEDENKIESIKGLITTGRFVDANTIRTIWKLLDSLSPRPSWKPSEEQMISLRLSFEEAFDDAGDCNRYRRLKSLYEQLEKL